LQQIVESEMKVFIVSSNKYAAVVPINLFFLEKYWPEADVTVLGYEGLNEVDGFSPNQEVVILGNQDDFGKSWSSALIPYFEKTKHDYFVILVEDFILMNRVDHNKIRVLEEEIKSGKAQKAVIGGGLDTRYTSRWENNLFLYSLGIDYRCTLHPSIWNRDYFLKWLNPGDTIWDFEVKNNEMIKYDGANIIGYEENWPNHLILPLYSSLNLYAGKTGLTINEDGKILDDQPSSKYFNVEDTKMIWRWVNETKQ